ncbi:MAG: hypothetical protein U1F29_06625 [Planctomycetota bacterium]
MRRRLSLLLIALAAATACVSPKHPEPPPNERDPSEVRAERTLRGAGGLLQAVAGFVRAKS